MSAVFGTWPPGGSAAVTFAAVAAALATANADVAFNFQDLTEVGSVNGLSLEAGGASGSLAIGPTIFDETTTDNTIVGMQAAGGALTTGQSNTALGFQALQALTTGNSNVAIGRGAGFLTTTAAGNVLLGQAAGAFVTTSSNNVCIGTSAGGQLATGAGGNVIIGDVACAALSTGADNIMVGRSVGSLLTTGGSNVCIGHNTGDTLTVASNNTLIGSGAGDANTNGNIMIGFQAVSPDNTATAQLSIGNLIWGDIGTAKVRISSAAGSLSAQTDLFRVRSTGADTAAIASLESTGANGALTQDFCGARDPNGAVSAPAGSTYRRVSGATSNFYVNTSAGTGTTWTAAF